MAFFSVAADPRHPILVGRSIIRRLGLAHSVPAVRDPFHDFDLDPIELERIAGFPENEERGKNIKSAPLADAFANWSSAKTAIFILLGETAGATVVWYSGQFYALLFLTQTIKVPTVTAQIMILVALALGTPAFILFGWLSDKVGRKPIVLVGFLLAAATYFPVFKGITHFANPKLEAALNSAPVTVIADPGECSFQLKATGTEKFTTSCDVAKSALVGLSVNYTNQEAQKGTPTQVKVGDQILTATSPDFATALPAAIKAHGYPTSADPTEIDTVMTTLLLWILVIYVTLVYAPTAAWLVEFVPKPDSVQRHVAALSYR